MFKKRNNFPYFFSHLEKTKKSNQSNIEKLQNAFCELRKTWKCSLRLILPNPSFDSTNEMGKARS